MRTLVRPGRASAAARRRLVIALGASLLGIGGGVAAAPGAGASVRGAEHFAQEGNAPAGATASGTPVATITRRSYASNGGVFVVRLRGLPQRSTCVFTAGAGVTRYAAKHTCGGGLFAHSGRVLPNATGVRRRWTVRATILSGARTRHFAWVVTIAGRPASPTGPSSGGAGSATAPPLVPAANCAPAPASGPSDSTNWAGYVLSVPNGCATEVGATWAVPTLDCAASALDPGAAPTQDANWVGVDGTGTTADLFQTGTASECVNGVQLSHAWYEDIQGNPPAPEVALFPVNPGDTISASVSQVTAGLWQYTITDATSGEASSQLAYSGPGASADWIEEDPSVESANGTIQLVPFANCGAVSFTSITLNGSPPSLTTGDATNIVQHGTSLAVAGPPTPTGFTVACS